MSSLIDEQSKNAKPKKKSNVDGEGTENAHSKRVLPKRKARWTLLGHRFDSLSPPKKRGRWSTVLQQSKILPNVHLDKFGFENEDEDEENATENVRPRISRPPPISLLLQPTMTTRSKVPERRVPYVLEASRSRKSSVWPSSNRISTKNLTSSRKSKPRKTVVLKGSTERIESTSPFKKPLIMLKNAVAYADDKSFDDKANLIDGAQSKFGKVINGNVDDTVKCDDGSFVLKLRKPIIKLKRMDAFAGARFVCDELDSSVSGSEGSREDKDSDFSIIAESSGDPPSSLRTSSSFGFEKKRETKRGTRKSSKRKNKGADERKLDGKYNKCGIISNVFPKMTFSTQRVETLELVRRRLHTSEIPERLPCREAEFERICAFIRECVGNDATSQAMYVSGVPGTGKTATVLQAIRHLKNSKDFSNFDFVVLNAMELANPMQIFVEIYRELFTSKRIAPKTARKKLNEIFQYRDKYRLPVILLVDELDLLNTKRQEIVYDIFNWSANEESLVSVIAIANTLDLPERLLTQRISSRLGANRLCFQPYDHDEVAYIIRDRLRGSTAVEAEAIELASRKVAAVSGDLRKALDILRSAAELAINANQKQLTMKNVHEAIRHASTNVRVELIRALPRHSVLLLRAALAERMSSGLNELQFHILFKQYCLQCRVANIVPISTSAAYRNAMEMCSARLLIAAPGAGNWSRLFRLGMTTHDIQFALKQIDESVF